MKFKVENDKGTFRSHHFGLIIGVAVFLLALNWMRSGFLLAGKPIENNPLDLVASNQAYNEWQALGSQPNDDAVAVSKPTQQSTAVAIAAPEGAVLGESDSAPDPVEAQKPLPQMINAMALPLLSGKFTADQVSEVAERLQKVLEAPTYPID